MDNNAEEMIEFTQIKYDLSRKQAINLLINVVSTIFDEDQDLIFKHIKEIK